MSNEETEHPAVQIIEGIVALTKAAEVAGEEIDKSELSDKQKDYTKFVLGSLPVLYGHNVANMLQGSDAGD